MSSEERKGIVVGLKDIVIAALVAMIMAMTVALSHQVGVNSHLMSTTVSIDRAETIFRDSEKLLLVNQQCIGVRVKADNDTAKAIDDMVNGARDDNGKVRGGP